MIETAIILAGGLGTRLRPLTEETPKPLLPLLGKPIVQHTIERLKKQGIKNVILSIGHKADKIREYFEDGSKFGVHLSYCLEDQPLGTGGAIKKSCQGITTPVFVIWGDNLMDIDYRIMFEKYHQEPSKILMTLTPREDVENFGVARLENNKIISFVEKPKREEAPSNLINAGAIILEPKILEMLPEGKSSMEYDLYEKLAPGEITAFIHEGQWFPTDTLEKYSFACQNFKPCIDLKEKKIIIADVDDTIVESCQQISEKMAKQINRMIKKGFSFAFISGTKSADLMKMISSGVIEEHHILGTTGTNYTLMKNNIPLEIYNHAFTEKEKKEIFAAFEKTIDHFNIQSMTTKEDQLQDRESQITLSAIGRNAPSELKRAYDPDGAKRIEYVEYLKQFLDENRYEIKWAGTTSIDITRKGLDKEWGIREFAKYKNIDLKKILFFGDKIHPGGNDYPASKAVDCIAVRNPKDTFKKLKELESQNNVKINLKYYNDIKQFPTQFSKGIELAKDIFVCGNFNKIVLCGMGGSSLYVDLINDYLKEDEDVQIISNRSYSLPQHCDQNTLFVVVSYSGNTEETLSCRDEIEDKKLKYVVFTSGGKLMQKAKEKNVPFFRMPVNIQPRLATGYFISGLIKVLQNCGIIKNREQELINAAERMDKQIDETGAKDLAKELINKVPLIYATDNNSSIARIAKIKFNENSKIQAFHNTFPELNHNEMVGFTNILMNPYFIIFKSKFTDQRNNKRIEVFSKLMKEKNLSVKIIEMTGENNLMEMLNAYYFIDHVTYYLAEEYRIDPEPVAMVEEFKGLIHE